VSQSDPNRPGLIEAVAQRVGLGKLSTSALVRLVVLTLLERSEEPLTGIEIRRHFEAITQTAWKPSDDLLYNGVLRHLEEHGLVVGFKEKPRRGHSKVYYQISPLGRRLLQSNRENLAPVIEDTRKLLDTASRYIYGPWPEPSE